MFIIQVLSVNYTRTLYLNYIQDHNNELFELFVIRIIAVRIFFIYLHVFKYVIHFHNEMSGCLDKADLIVYSLLQNMRI